MAGYNRPVTRLAALAALLLAANIAAAAEPGAPPFRPILRLAGAPHEAEVTALAADGAGALLVSASLDKTARLWDLRSGALLQVLRPPIDEGRVGELYAAALSPDGETVAVTGTTGVFPGGGATIYLFDRRGRLTRLLGGPGLGQGSLYTMRFTADGARLFVASRTQGVLLLDARSGALLQSSGACGTNVPDLDIDGAGRVAAVGSFDQVCLFDGALRLLRETRRPLARGPIFLMYPPGGIRPHAVRFSPDGARLAVGYGDGPRVDVRSAADLSLQYRPDAAGVAGDLSLVAWSSDGRVLYAGGEADGEGAAPLRRWEGPATFQDLPGPHRAVTVLTALPTGGLAYGAESGAWGVVDAPAAPRPPQPAAPGPPGALRVSPGGERVQLTLSGRRVELDLAARQLGPAPAAELPPPRLQGRVRLELGATSATLLVEGRPYSPIGALQPRRYRAWAFGPGGQALVVGTDQGLLFFPAPEQLRSSFQQRTPSPVEDVAYSGDGKLVVAALRDGTLRWYRGADGTPLLAARLEPEAARWVAFTPTGYYDASVGGEELIGWHRNRDADQAADFFPAARFRRRFHRPDVIARILALRDEERALADAGDAAPAAPPTPPPVVTLLSPSDGTVLRQGRVRVRVSVRAAPGDPVTALRALIDGRAAEVERGVVSLGAEAPPPPPGEQLVELTLSVPPRDCTLAVLAESAAGAGEPQSVRLRWAGEAQKDGGRPRLFVLAVGVSRYQRPELRLGYAAKDAADLAAALRGQAGRLFASVEARVLQDEAAGLPAVRAGLRWLAASAGPRDVAVLFLSGHGVGDGRRYAFLPQDGDPAAPSLQLDGEELRRTLASIPGRALLFLDSCHAGGVLPGAPALTSRFVNELASHESGVVVFVSATARQAAKESAEWKNGAFTRALLEGLAGQADGRRTGRVTVSMLDLYVSERVRELTGGAQTPAVAKPTLVPDFPLALLR